MAVDERLGGKFALETKVEVAKSRGDIQDLLEKYGADDITFAVSRERCLAVVAFRVDRYRVQINLPLPDPEAESIQFTHRRLNQNTGIQRVQRSPEQAKNVYEQLLRARWRQLLLVIRAKLEAVDIGISTLQQEFLADVLLPDGGKVGDKVIPIVEEAVATGHTPPGPFLIEGKR